MKVLSLGAGVQSTTLLLMACKGLIEKPDVAIFADTGWERQATYQHLTWLETEAFKYGIPVIRVKENNIRDDSLNGLSWMPAFGMKNGKIGMGRRQCTNIYKLKPIRKKVRELLDVVPRARLPKDAVEMWIGISLDEARRMKPSRDKWESKRYPLVEFMLTRNHCIKWLWDNYQLEVPKSACVGCPFHSKGEWQTIYQESCEWEDAILIDEAIRNSFATEGYTQFLHNSGNPLRGMNLETPEQKGQIVFPFYKLEKANLFATIDVFGAMK